MRNALIRNNVVMNVITSECPNPQDYQAVVDVTNVYCEPGWQWNGGTSFTKVVPVEVTNQRTLEELADAALAANLQFIADSQAAITQGQNWIAANPGSVTAANLSIAMRQVMQALIANEQRAIAADRQRNGIIRLLRGRLDATT